MNLFDKAVLVQYLNILMTKLIQFKHFMNNLINILINYLEQNNDV